MKNAAQIVSQVARAIESSEYVDTYGYWRQGKVATAAVEAGLVERGYVEVIRAASGWPIGVRPTERGVRFEARRYARHMAR